jgi:hypothetical protein
MMGIAASGPGGKPNTGLDVSHAKAASPVTGR